MESLVSHPFRKRREMGGAPSFSWPLKLRRELAGEADEHLRFLAGAEDGHAWDAAADHGYFVAAVQARAALAVFEDLVGQFGFVFDGAETVFEKEVGDAREQADGLDAVLFRFFDQRAENAAARALTLGFRLDHNRAHLAEMRAIKVQRAAAEKHAAIGFGDGEVANVFANLSEGALEQRTVGRERVHQVVDVGGVLEQGLTHEHRQPPLHSV